MKKKVTVQEVVLTSFFVDLLDIVINFTVAIFSGSIVMASELLQGISDLTASGTLIFGIKRPKREKYMWATLSAIIMLTIASSLSFLFGLERFLYPHQIKNLLLAYIGLIISIVSNGYAFLLSVKRIKNHPKKVLLMTRNTFVLDLMGMSAAIVGLIALALYQLTAEIRFDGVGAMGIGIVLGAMSIKLIWDIRSAKGKGDGDL